MECKSTENCIASFLDRTLSGEDLRQFLLHINKCESCMEELETAYLVREAIPRIEDGDAINLEKELRIRLDAADKALVIHWTLSNMMRSFEVAAGIALAFSAVRAFIVYVMPYVSFFNGF